MTMLHFGSVPDRSNRFSICLNTAFDNLTPVSQAWSQPRMPARKSSNGVQSPRLPLESVEIQWHCADDRIS
jgi:hypothetical protein